MPAKTAVAWSQLSWNICAFCCTHASPGCDNCYADTVHSRFHHKLWAEIGRELLYELAKVPTEARAPIRTPWQYLLPFNQPMRMKTFMRDVLRRPDLFERRLFWPLTVKQPSLIFVNSMTDLLHHVVPDEDIREAFAVMRAAHWHTFQILTKRGNRLRRLGPTLDWPPNVGMGVSIENELFLPRMDQLGVGAERAAFRFVSYEPALGPLVTIAPGAPLYQAKVLARDLKRNRVDWLIAGAESGKGARPMDLAWVRQARNASLSAGTAFFLKQFADAEGHKTQLPALDGEVWDQQPAVVRRWLADPPKVTASERRRALETVKRALGCAA